MVPPQLPRVRGARRSKGARVRGSCVPTGSSRFGERGSGRARLGLLLLAAVLASLASLLLGLGDGPLEAWGRSIRAAEPVEAKLETLLEVNEFELALRSSAAELSGVSVAAAGPTTSDPVPSAAAERRAGHLRVLRADGTLDEQPTGQLELSTWSESSEGRHGETVRGSTTLEVQDGRFVLDPQLEDGTSARFLQPLAFVDAANLAAAIPFDDADLWSSSAELFDQALEISAAEAQPLSISAIDGLSGLPLSRVKVEVFPTNEVLATPPGEWDAPAIQKSSGATPLILDPLPLLGGRSADCSLRVGAEGYSSTAVVVDRREPAELELVLWPAAALNVRTRGESQGTTWLEVERLDGGAQVTRHLLGGSSRSLEGLEPGVYGVTWVEVSNTGVQRRLDRASARLSAGETRDLWLEAPLRKPMESVSQVAELWLPESWFELEASGELDDAIHTSEHMLVLRSAQSGGFGASPALNTGWLGDPAPLHGATGRGLASLGSAKHEGEPGRLFEFSAAGLPAGRYAATLIPEGVALWIELPPFGSQTPRFVAPEPVEWELDTYAVAEIAGHEPPGPLQWAVQLPGFEGPRIPREVLPNDEGRYVFLAPRGELELELAGTTWAIDPNQQRTEISQQTLELIPLTQFGLFLQLDDQPFAWNASCEVELHSDTGDQAVYAFEGHSLLSRLGVGVSGAYRVVVRAPGGASWASTPLYFGSLGHEKVVKLTPQ